MLGVVRVEPALRVEEARVPEVARRVGGGEGGGLDDTLEGGFGELIHSVLFWQAGRQGFRRGRCERKLYVDLTEGMHAWTDWRLTPAGM